jgi:hypothetical protein
MFVIRMEAKNLKRKTLIKTAGEGGGGLLMTFLVTASLNNC